MARSISLDSRAFDFDLFLSALYKWALFYYEITLISQLILSASRSEINWLICCFFFNEFQRWILAFLDSLLPFKNNISPINNSICDVFQCICLLLTFATICNNTIITTNWDVLSLNDYQLIISLIIYVDIICFYAVIIV